MSTIRDLLERLPIVPVEQGNDTQIALALANGELTSELAEILRITYGIELPTTDLFGFEEARNHPAWSAIRHEFPGGVLIGWNRASELFFVDAGDTLHAGAGAVFAVDKVYVEPSSVRLIAPDLATFLELASAQQPDLSQPYYTDALTDRLRTVIETYPERVDAGPPLGRFAIADKAAARNLILPGTYAAFLEVANGLRFVRSGLEIFSLEQLGPIGTERPARLLHCGHDEKRKVDLAITAKGLSRPSDLLLQMGASDDLASAPSYGRLLNTLIEWIESDAEERP